MLITSNIIQPNIELVTLEKLSMLTLTCNSFKDKLNVQPPDEPDLPTAHISFRCDILIKNTEVFASP